MTGSAAASSRWWASIGRIGSDASDDRETRLRKTSLVTVSLAVVAMATLWVVPFFLLDRPLGAAMPLAYQVLTVANVAVFARTRRFAPFAWVQILQWLTLPFAFQWALGGFAAGSVVMIWAFLATIAALLYLGRRASLACFAGYLLLIGVSALIDPALRGAVQPLAEPIRRTFFALNIGGVSVVTFGLLAWVDHRRRTAQAQSDSLLRNVLPVSIAERLMDGEQVIAEAHPAVSVLFADIVDFTPFAERTPADRVVSLLDLLFTAFDGLAHRHGLEKIKTIGDAYMAVAGAPTPRSDHAQAAVSMALEMHSELSRVAATSGLPVQLRIGIASGPVIAGVIGRQKFLYDLWGDTVNTASRMESSGVPGCIQMTQATYDGVKHRYAIRPRLAHDIKGKGEMTVYLLRATDAGLPDLSPGTAPD